MTDVLFLHFGKLTGSGRLLAAARHNKRALQAEHGASAQINARLSHLNYCVAGEQTPQAICEKSKRMRTDAKIGTLRRDAVQAIEALFSLPVGTSVDHHRYFEDCTRWAAKRFGQDNILSSDVHLDEAAPHCHVLVMPLRDSRMNGSAMIGGPKQLNATLDDFFVKVGNLYGLSRATGRMSKSDKLDLAATVIKRLLSDSDGATRSRAWGSIRNAIQRDPGPFAATLGIEIPTAKGKSFVEIFTGTGKRTSEDKKHIAFAPQTNAKPNLCRFLPSAPAGSLPEYLPNDSENTARHDELHTAISSMNSMRDRELA